MRGLDLWRKVATLSMLLVGSCQVLLGAQDGAVGQANAVCAGCPSSAQGTSTGRMPELQQRNRRYKLAKDDVFAVSFPLSPELNQTVTVQPDGFISLLNVGSLLVDGMTIPEVAIAIKNAYANILNDPIVDVSLQNFQHPFFVASGQVGKPGQYTLREDITVSEALAVAGGMLPTAKTQVFLFRRIGDSWAEVKQVNIKDVLNGKTAVEDVHLKPGDMIYVPEKFITNFRKYVPYSFGMYVDPKTSF
jgi:polysaccharide biosynthesis/export protein